MVLPDAAIFTQRGKSFGNAKKAAGVVAAVIQHIDNVIGCKMLVLSDLTSARISADTNRLAVGPGHRSATDGLLLSSNENSWGWTGPLKNLSMLP